MAERRWMLFAWIMLIGCGGANSNPDGGSIADGSLDDAALDPLSRDGGADASGGADAAGADANLTFDGSLAAGDGSIPFEINEAGQVLCGNEPCACSNGIDDDADGLTDLADPECVSSWDNDEGSFATGISGDNRDDACQDCFFDGNSGSGNDGCRLPSSCLIDGTPSSGQGSCNSCEQAEACQTYCEAFTPNGCDCFGCCEVRVGGKLQHVLIGEGCQIDGDTIDGCTLCKPSDSCVNECGKCELCPGKTVADLPPECFSGTPDGGAPDGGTSSDAGSPDASEPPPYTCDSGEQVCGAGLAGCAQGFYCEFGCCVRVPIIL